MDIYNHFVDITIHFIFYVIFMKNFLCNLLFLAKIKAFHLNKGMYNSWFLCILTKLTKISLLIFYILLIKFFIYKK